jgi:acetolactate synthase-1/2/3 large subunit
VNNLKISEEILRYLYGNGVKTIYGYPSGTTGFIWDSFNDFKDIEIIIPNNEAAVSYAACKAAKVSNQLQVCLMSGAVGVSNAMNGIAEAYQTKVPLLIISGYVDEKIQGKVAMQEIESHRYLGGITKYNTVIKDNESIIKELKKAIEIALEYPRGPVHIGIPANFQKQEYKGGEVSAAEVKPVRNDFEQLGETVEAINRCYNGVIMVGGGCRGFGDKIKKLAEKLNWRIITTASGKGIIEEDYTLNMGNYGFTGTDVANEYMQRDDIDCVLALGTQLGQNATAYYSSDLCKNKVLIHIDIDENTFNRAYDEDIKVKADLNCALEYIIENVEHKELDNYVTGELNKKYINNHTGLSMRKIYEEVPRYLPRDTFYMSDIGSNMVYSSIYLRIPKQGDYECNTNHACMGSTIGFIGINRLNPNRPIAVFTGDGAFYMNIMSEMLTAKKYNMKVVFFVNNNLKLNYVNNGHKKVFGRTIDLFSYHNINISEIGKAMGIESMRIDSNDKIGQLEEFLKSIHGPMLVELVTDCSEEIPSTTNRFSAMK